MQPEDKTYMHKEEISLATLRRADTIESQKSLADELGISAGKVNYILKALIEKGLIKADNFYKAKNKRKYKYLLTQKGLEEKITLTKKFIELKKKEYEELQRELESHS